MSHHDVIGRTNHVSHCVELHYSRHMQVMNQLHDLDLDLLLKSYLYDLESGGDTLPGYIRSTSTSTSSAASAGVAVDSKYTEPELERDQTNFAKLQVVQRVLLKLVDFGFAYQTDTDDRLYIPGHIGNVWTQVSTVHDKEVLR